MIPDCEHEDCEGLGINFVKRLEEDGSVRTVYLCREHFLDVFRPCSIEVKVTE